MSVKVSKVANMLDAKYTIIVADKRNYDAIGMEPPMSDKHTPNLTPAWEK
jgi:hypothetical protein